MRPFGLILVTILAISACCLAQARAASQSVAPAASQPALTTNQPVAPTTSQPFATTSPGPVTPGSTVTSPPPASVNGIVVNGGFASSGPISPPLIIAPTADPNALTNPVAAANAAPKTNVTAETITTGPVRAINLGGASFSTIYTAPAAPDHRSLAEIANYYRAQGHASKVYTNADIARLNGSSNSGVSIVPRTPASAPAANPTGTTGGTVGAIANPAAVAPGAAGQQPAVASPSGTTAPPAGQQQPQTRAPFNPPTTETAPLPPPQAPPQQPPR